MNCTVSRQLSELVMKLVTDPWGDMSTHATLMTVHEPIPSHSVSRLDLRRFLCLRNAARAAGRTYELNGFLTALGAMKKIKLR